MDEKLTVSRLVKLYFLFTILDILLCFLCLFLIFVIPIFFCLPGPVSLPLALLFVLFSESNATVLAAGFFLVYGVFFLVAALYTWIRKKPWLLLAAAVVDPLARILLMVCMLLAGELMLEPGAFFIGLGILLSSAYAILFWRQVKRERAAEAAPVKKAFSASLREIAAALLMYVLAWWYLFRSDLFLFGVIEERKPLWTLIVVLGFLALTELLHWGRKRSRESWVWLGCILVITLSVVLGRNQVWEWKAYLFLHLIAVWWVLCRSGRLTEGRSGHLFLLDGLNGFVIFPCYHFFLRVRSLWYALTSLRRDGRKIKTATILWSSAALLAALLLFVKAADLLIRADAGFGKLLEGVADWFRWDLDLGTWFMRLLLSLPVGQYLFGLIAGSGREDPAVLRARGENLLRGLAKLRKVPNLVWTVLTGAFCLLYLIFFAVQSRYLFGAFTRTLPEGFIVSEYARQGFFELCKVMGVNFALLWLVTRASRRPVRENRPALVLCLILLGESLLFAVVAFSKLALYIDCFGFTPLRLQSSWLVCVLFAGCIAFGWNLLTEKRSFRPWLIFSAATMSLLCLV